MITNVLPPFLWFTVYITDTYTDTRFSLYNVCGLQTAGALLVLGNEPFAEPPKASKKKGKKKK